MISLRVYRSGKAPKRFQRALPAWSRAGSSDIDNEISSNSGLGGDFVYR